MNEKSALPCKTRDRPLPQVVQDFGERVRPGGPYGEIDEWSLYDESFRRLVAWSEASGCFFPDLEPLKEGGREHDLTHLPHSGEWLKFTKPSAAGYVVSFDSGMPALEPAFPSEYFERLILQNEIFADTVSFVGVSGQRHNPRIITRQADIAGEAADEGEIIRMMTSELGFSLLPSRFAVGYYDSLGFVRDDVAVFDLRPANVVRTSDGFIVVIDPIPVRLDDGSRRMLEA